VNGFHNEIFLSYNGNVYKLTSVLTLTVTVTSSTYDTHEEVAQSFLYIL